MIGELASGKRFLNLFAYTGTATVYAAGGGATASTTVDMSRTYLDWAKRNLALNELAGPAHGFVQANCLTWLAEQRDKCAPLGPDVHRSADALALQAHERGFRRAARSCELLTLARELLTPRGTILFSNNFTRFKLDAAALAAFEIEDIGRITLPEDFGRSPRIHSCFVLRARCLKLKRGQLQWRGKAAAYLSQNKGWC